MPAEERDQYLRTAFTLFDEDAIGALELTQLLACMKAAGIDMNRRQALAILRELRLTADGVVDLPRFFKFIEIASRSTEVASQFKANQKISATKKKIINVYVVVLFFLTFALTLIYISASSKSKVLLVGIVFLAVLLAISVFYVILFPLFALKLRRRRLQVLPDTPLPSADPRLVVFRVNSEIQDLERQDDAYSVSAIQDDPEIFTSPIPPSQSYRKPVLMQPDIINALEDGTDGPDGLGGLDAVGAAERRSTESEVLAIVPVDEMTITRSSFNPLRSSNTDYRR